MDDLNLLRYSRHILLSEIGIEGQEKLNNSKVLLVGAGGLGSPISIYLASSGLGELTICDDDKVDLTNLQRQILYNTKSIGEKKVIEAKKFLNQLNPQTKINSIDQNINDKNLEPIIDDHDLVLDASDNFRTRHVVNYVCVKKKKPLISGAAIKFEGQISVYDLREKIAPCYNCLYPKSLNFVDEKCSSMGVFAPLLGIVGSIQAAEAIKLILGHKSNLRGKLMIFDSFLTNVRIIKINKDPDCGVCI